MIRKAITLIFTVVALHATAQVSYNMVGPIQYPEGLENSPGQLGKKGKMLFIPLEKGDRKSVIYMSKRKKVGKAFNVYTEVKGLTEDAYQPSVDAKGKIMVYVSSGVDGGWLGNDLYIATRDSKKGPFTNVRKLDEVNDPNGVDAYPFLTADGLGLYFFRNRQCYHASREKTTENFSAPQLFAPVNALLDTNGGAGIVSLWLSNNGKTLMVLDENKIYRSDRKKTKDQFEGFELYVAEETFDGLDFISGITFTDDLEEFYVYSDPDDGSKQMLWFRKSKY